MFSSIGGMQSFPFAALGLGKNTKAGLPDFFLEARICAARTPLPKNGKLLRAPDSTAFRPCLAAGEIAHSIFCNHGLILNAAKAAAAVRRRNCQPGALAKFVAADVAAWLSARLSARVTAFITSVVAADVGARPDRIPE